MHRGPTNSMTRSNSSCDLQIFAAMSPAVLDLVASGSRSRSAAKAFINLNATLSVERAIRSNEKKMSDAGQERTSLAVEVWKSSQMWPQNGPAFAPSHG